MNNESFIKSLFEGLKPYIREFIIELNNEINPVDAQTGVIGESPFLTPKEAAKYLKVSKSYLDNLRSNGGGPKFIKIGRSVKYNIDDLRKFAERKKQRHTLV